MPRTVATVVHIYPENNLLNMTTILKFILNYRKAAVILSLLLGFVSLAGCIAPPNRASDGVDIDARTPSKPSEADATATPGSSSEPVQDTAESSASGDVALVPDEDPIEPANLTTITLGDLAEEKGTPYSDIREGLLERGWIPHTFVATNGTPRNSNNSRVLRLEGRFPEIKECSGTGQGFCVLKFVYRNRTAENGPVLVVTTAGEYPDLVFWDFRLEEVSNLTYIERSFDQALFTQLRDEESFCLGIGRCEYAQYMLKDALLIGGSGDFGSTKISLIPTTPISKDAAIAYARILDVEGVIDFSKSRIDSKLNVETYYEAGLVDEEVAERGGVTLVRLKLTPEGMVSEISFNTIVL